LALLFPYLLGRFHDLGDPDVLMYICPVLWTGAVALRDDDVVLVHESARPQFL
jgi:hypothetical protein